MNKGGESAGTARGTGWARAHRPSACAAHRLASPWHHAYPQLRRAACWAGCGPDLRSKGTIRDRQTHTFFRTQEGTRAPGSEDRKSAPQTSKAPRCFVCLDDKGQAAGATAKETEALCGVRAPGRPGELLPLPLPRAAAQHNLISGPGLRQARHD